MVCVLDRIYAFTGPDLYVETDLCVVPDTVGIIIYHQHNYCWYISIRSENRVFSRWKPANSRWIVVCNCSIQDENGIGASL